MIVLLSIILLTPKQVVDTHLQPIRPGCQKVLKPITTHPGFEPCTSTIGALEANLVPTDAMCSIAA